jgi:hypothetical protein
MLAGHPEIYGFPEMLIFSTSTVDGLLNENRRSPDLPPAWVASRLGGILRAVAEVHEGRQDEPAIARAKEWLEKRRDWTAVDLMDHLLRLVHPKLALEKSPETVGSDEALRRCLEAYPDARYIHLTRHPVTTQRSMREKERRRLPDDPEIALVAQSASAWYLGHRRAMAALDALPADRWIRVRAEDLIRAPYDELPRILGWLGLDHGPEIVEGMLHTERWRFAGPGDTGTLGGGDPEFMKAPALRPIPEPGPVVFDPELGLLDEMRRRMTDLAEQLGY